jgi:hypothetical protein
MMIIVGFHVFKIEGVAEGIEMSREGILEVDHNSDAINGSLFINPNTMNLWWDGWKVQPWGWKFKNMGLEHVCDDVMR